MHTHIKIGGNRLRGSTLGWNTCFVVFPSPMQRGLSATYPAPISTIFETKDVNRCPHAYTSEKFPNFCAGGGFQAPKQLKKGNFEGVLVMRVQLKRHNFGHGNRFRG